MKEIVLAVSREALDSATHLQHRRHGDRHVYWDGVSTETDRYIVLLYGDLYEGGEPATEILAGYERCGERCLDRLNGDFGIVLFDKQLCRVVAARDRFGVKSLFYRDAGGDFIVSNSIPAVFRLRPETKKPDLRKNLFYVGSHYRHIDAFPEDTFYEDIHSIRQGHYICWENGAVKKGPYWKFELLDLGGKSREELAAEYLAILSESIRKRLDRSADPVFMVSSGLDSSGVAALAAQVSGGKVPIITTVFEEETEYNEAPEIVPVARKIGREWHRLTVRGDAILGDIDGILQEANMPFYTITQLMHHYLCREARERGFRTVFGGLGGDEANCGEIEEYLFYFADLKHQGRLDRLSDEIVGWTEYHAHPLYPKGPAVVDTFFRKQIDFDRPGAYTLDLERFGRYFHVFREEFRRAYFATPRLEFPFQSYLLNKLYQDLFAEVIPCVLGAEEFNLRRFGLAGRLPYLDHEVMQYGFSIPITMKYSQGGTKAVLREALKGILPDETLGSFVKKGWNAPFNEWLKTHLRGPIDAILDEPTLRQKEVYDLAAVSRLWGEHLQGRANHMLFFWQFLNYEKWFGIHFS